MLPYTILLKRFQFWGLYPFPHNKYNSLHFDVVIVRVDAIGDYIIWHDTLKVYKERFNGKRILFICADLVCPLAEKEDFFSEIWGFNRKLILEDRRYMYTFLKKVASVSANLVINPLWSRHPIGDVIIKTIYSGKKIGMVGNCCHDLMWRWYNTYYDELFPNPDTISELKAVEYFTQKGISPDYKYGHNPIKMTDDNPPIHTKYIVISISASDKYRIWSLQKFSEIINIIPSEYSIVLSGAGEDDLKRAKIIISHVEHNERIINMVDKTDLSKLISLIGHSSFVIGNDSAAVHIAAATHVPSVCILVGAHYNRFIPYPPSFPFPQYSPRVVHSGMECFGCNYHCRWPKIDSYECLNRITVDMVRNEVKKLIR